METKKYVVFLHSTGLSQRELMEASRQGRDFREMFEDLREENLRDIVKNPGRRLKILENYRKLNTKDIEKVLEKQKVNIVLENEEEYPESLRNIPHSPYILYIRGNIPKQDMFGVVGSRKISTYGKKCIEKIVPDISKILPIVSGGAAGCDTWAHKTALESGTKTVVVVGTGIDQTYPVSNEKLFDTIVESGGAIVSIFRVGEPGNPYNFPVRNEIVVGLSQGVLVIEAQKRSGSLITAGLCLDLGKDLFTIPGDITHSGSVGTNNLIKKGEAKCVTESLDVLEEYDIIIKKSSHKQQLPLLDSLESELYKIISMQESSIDDIANKLSKTSAEISMKLSMLELKKCIKKNMSGKYTLL